MNKHVHLTQEEANKINQNLPSDHEITEVSNFFKIFGDKTRFRILLTLQGRELCVHDISLALNMSQSAISHQLRTLREAGLVSFVKNGKEVIYSITNDRIEEVFLLGLNYKKP